MTQVINANPSFPIGFQPLAGTRADCDAWGNAERVGFSFEFAYQPIVDVQTHQVFAHEALVRGPQGEGAASVLAQVNELNLARLCEEMGITVIAEGIKTPAERDFVADCGIRLMQGYLFAKPALRAMAPLREEAFATAR